MKTILRIGIFLLATTFAWGQTNSLRGLLQQGLFEEQANRNLEAAIADYQSLAAQFDKDRQLAATAVFRLGECYRAQGHTNEAAAQYQRILHEFSDQQTLATLSRQNLAGMGLTGRSTGPVEPTAVESPEAQLWNKLKDMPPDQLAKVLPTLAPDATLDSLMQQRNDAQAKMAQIELDYSSSNIVYLRQETLLKEIRQQTDDRITGIMQALKLKAELPQQRGSFQNRLQSIVGRASPPGAQNADAVTTDEEAHEIQRIQQLIQNSPDLINGSSGGSTLLVTAAYNGWLKVATYLLDHGADVNGACFGIRGAVSDLYNLNGPHVTPLVAAVRAGNKAMTQLLLERGADAGFKGQEGNTPLHLAARNGFQAVTEVLLASHADVNALNFAGTTPLFSAVEGGQLKIMKLLLTAGAKVNLKDSQGRTVLNFAIHTSPEMMQALLDAGVDPNTQDKDGRTPMSYATERDSAAVVKLLLAAKADPNGGGLDLPLLCAIYAKNLASAEELLQAGANPSARGPVNWDITGFNGNGISGNDKPSTTPLNLAVTTGQLPMVQALLKFKANPNDTREGERGLLFNALPDTNMLAGLLAGGADTESHDPTFSNNGDRPNWTPLAAAVWKRSSEAVELLLQHGANPNARDAVGDVPLHWAVSYLWSKLTEQNSKIVELLLDHGTDPNVRNNAGYLPLDWATRRLGKNDDPVDKLNAAKIARMMHQHGAMDKLPDWNSITMSRPTANFSHAIFHKGTNDWNQFTLLEAIRNFYSSTENHPVSQGSTTSWYGLSSMLPFPDLARVAILRPGRNSTNQTSLIVNVLNETNGIDFSKDLPLMFGDVVEIPERDHALGDAATGLAENQRKALVDYTAGWVRLEVKDQHVDIPIYRTGGQALLTTILEQPEARKLLLTSSDLSQVKVARRASKTGKSREWILNCSPPPPAGNGNGAMTINGGMMIGNGTVTLAGGNPPLGYQWSYNGNNSAAEGNGNELWLRDGDVISVPEKR